jgi:hypothetical protein
MDGHYNGRSAQPIYELTYTGLYEVDGGASDYEEV